VSDDKRTHGGLSVKTLLIAAAASAVAAIVIPMLWRPGTVFAAAMTPIVVALVTEALRRPVETVGAVRVRRTARGTAILDPPPEEPFDPLAPPSAEELAVLPEPREAPRAVHRRRPLTARQWKLALATGLVAFAAVAAVFTASELVAGDAISGGGSRTTFFGGSDRDRSEPESQPAERERKTAEPTATATPEETATPEPTATATPTPTPTPTMTPSVTPTAEPAEPAPTP
jgi:hypothetical protein